MNEKVKQIANRLKEIREISDFSVDEIVSRLSINKDDYLSYEKSGENIPISVLYELANIYGVDMTEILTGKSARLDNYCVVKKGHSLGIDRYPGYHFESLAYKFKHKIMEPLMVTVMPNEKEMKLITHPGQEFNYVVQGTIMVIIDDEEVKLEEGECIYFNPELPHGQKALNGKTAKFLTVITER